MQLDHRSLRTPLRQLFLVPSEPLALAVAQEWDSQGQTLQPALMHLVRETAGLLRQIIVTICLPRLYHLLL